MKKITFVFCMIALSLTLLGAQSVESVAKANAYLPTRPPAATKIPWPAGGLIKLHVKSIASSNPENMRTIVQWVDMNGQWHNVEGWEGDFNEALEVTWWVAPNDLGKGPFRWVIYDNEKNDLIYAISDTFYLPRYDGGTVEIELILP